MLKTASPSQFFTPLPENPSFSSKPTFWNLLGLYVFSFDPKTLVQSPMGTVVKAPKNLGKSTDKWVETVRKVDTHLHPPPEPAKGFWALVQKVCAYLGWHQTAGELFQARMQHTLDQGCCHGISMNLLAESLNDHLDPKERQTRIAAFQLCQDLRVQLNRTTPSTDKAALLTELATMQRSLTGNETPLKLTESSLGDFKQRQSGKVVVSIQGPGLISHSVFVDLDKKQIYDINLGVFQYTTRDELHTAFHKLASRYQPRDCKLFITEKGNS
ncbi:MAG: hypothetical protein FJZ58_06375 [Chlamydiae bacterium]|nr:hypothetical protein [Chlamydiota bacterium]